MATKKPGRHTESHTKGERNEASHGERMRKPSPKGVRAKTAKKLK